jgi:hypothetical protein
VCCTRRASICAARDDPLRDFIPAAPCTRSRGISLSARIRGCKGGICTSPRRFKISTPGSLPQGGRSMIASQADREATRQRRPTDGNRTLALEILGISREGLRTKVADSPICSDGRARLRIRQRLRNHAVILGWTTTKKSPCRNCFLADCAAESDSLHV